MKWKIVADSSCDLTNSDFANENFIFETVPLKIIFGQNEFVDDATLDISALLAAMADSKGPSSTACPSPDEWYNAFLGEEAVLAITISSNLSGSYNSAMVARDLVLEESPDKKIFVLDSRAVAGTMILLIEKARDLISQSLTFDSLVEQISEFQTKPTTLCTLSSYENLVKNGRMSRFTGMIATSLGLRAVAHTTPAGFIEVIHKSRGEQAAFKYMINHMGSLKDMKGLHVTITHCNNILGAQTLKSALERTYQLAKVSILPTRGLTAYYADQLGLIVCF